MEPSRRPDEGCRVAASGVNAGGPAGLAGVVSAPATG